MIILHRLQIFHLLDIVHSMKYEKFTMHDLTVYNLTNNI